MFFSLGSAEEQFAKGLNVSTSTRKRDELYECLAFSSLILRRSSSLAEKERERERESVAASDLHRLRIRLYVQNIFRDHWDSCS